MTVNQVIIPDALKGTLRSNLQIAPSELEAALRKFVQDSTVLTKKKPNDQYYSIKYKSKDVYFEYINQDVTVKDIA
jgi:hypothetical protein